MKKSAVLLIALVMMVSMMIPAAVFAEDEETYKDGFYTTTVNSDKESYGYVKNDQGEITQYGFNYPSKNYDFPVTIQIQDGKIVDVAYTRNVVDLVANTSSDINYLMWAMDGHNVTEASYNYLAAPGKNYEKYHVNPPMNGVGIRDQIIAKNGTDGVDTVTAATITSRAIINSVNLSLEKAKKGEKDDPAPDLPKPDTTPDVIPEEGVYFAKNVACIGADIDSEDTPMILTVKDGAIFAQMAVQQRQASYPYIFPGTEKEALEIGEEGWFYPVDYDYGYKYPGSLYKDVPIKSLDKKVQFVMHAKSSGNWFNRLITIKSEDLVKVPYGNYEANDFKFEGGTGKTTITCEAIRVRRSGITCDIAFSSTKYTDLEVDGVHYEPVVKDGKTVFSSVPMNINGQTAIKGTTVAMSNPQTIEYVCTVNFDHSDLKPIERVFQDGFYTTEVNSNKESYGYVTDDQGKITQYGFNYPSANYDFPVTIQIKDGKIVDVAYTQNVLDVVANTSSDINYLMWAMDGHNVTEASYNYLAGKGKNYEKYHVHPPMNGTGIRDQIIAKNGTDGVDTVTAATITSRAIINSVEQSLDKAEAGEKDDPAPDLPKPDTSKDIIPDDGVYIASDVDCIGASIDNDIAPMILYVEDGKIVADMGVEQRQATYPYIYAGTEKEALAAGEEGWLYPVDYDYGYKNPGSMYKNVPIKSLDKKIQFVMHAKSSGNWFNRLVTISSEKITEIPQNNDDWKYSAASFKAVKDAFDAFITARDTAGTPAADIETAKDALITALAGLKPHEHNYQPVLGSDKKPTCTEDGKEVDKECTECHDKVTGAPIAKLPHTPKHKAFKKATDKKEGNTEYWQCSSCKKYFKDTECTKEITKKSTVIPKNNMTVKVKSKSYSAQSKKNTTIKAGKIYKVTNNKGAMSYKKASGDKKITVAKNGNITVKKGLKKGKTFTVKVKATSKATAKYEACTKTVSVKIKVK